MHKSLNSKLFFLSRLDSNVSTIVPDSPHKIFIGGLPNYLNEDQVRSTVQKLDKRITSSLLKVAVQESHIEWFRLVECLVS